VTENEAISFSRAIGRGMRWGYDDYRAVRQFISRLYAEGLTIESVLIGEDFEKQKETLRRYISGDSN